MIPLKDNIPTGCLPVVTIGLIVANLLVLGWQLTLSGDVSSTEKLAAAGVSKRDQASIEYGAIPYRLMHPGSSCGVTTQSIVCGHGGVTEAGGPEGTPIPEDLNEPAWWITPLTSMFMHYDLLHAAINLLLLWVFGAAIEARMGRGRLLGFYLLAGIVAAFTQGVLVAESTGPVIGAAGAVAGLLGGYMLLRPRGRIVSLSLVPYFGGIQEIPAWLVVAVFFGLQLIPGFGNLVTPDVAEGGTAYLAHFGGILFGLLAVRLFMIGRKPLPPFLAASTPPTRVGGA